MVSPGGFVARTVGRVAVNDRSWCAPGASAGRTPHAPYRFTPSIARCTSSHR